MWQWVIFLSAMFFSVAIIVFIDLIYGPYGKYFFRTLDFIFLCTLFWKLSKVSHMVIQQAVLPKDKAKMDEGKERIPDEVSQCHTAKS